MLEVLYLFYFGGLVSGMMLGIVVAVYIINGR